MAEKRNDTELNAMLRRWAYMVIAIVAAALVTSRPVFNFQDDKGIIYIRSFSMDKTTFYVTQTELRTGAEEITETVPIAWMYYSGRAMFWMCVICFLCFFNDRWRIILCGLTIFCAGAYYTFLVYYALKLTEECYATMYPNFMTFLPAIVIQMMILTWRNVAHNAIIRNEDEE